MQRRMNILYLIIESRIADEQFAGYNWIGGIYEAQQ